MEFPKKSHPCPVDSSVDRAPVDDFPMASRYSAKITEETVLVTPTNFNKQLPLIRERLQTCVYSAVDLEMTGIVAERNSKIDDIATRYVKMVVAATRYSIIQFGLCIFAEESDGRDGIVLRASPYSFYIFSNERFGSDIVLSPGSIQFLKENKMDFGKWINEGLSFVGADKAADMRAKEQARLSKSELPVAAGAGISTLTPTSPTDLAFFNQHIAAIRLWYADSTVTEPYSIPSMHPFLRRCFYEFIESRLRAVLVTKAAGAPTVMVLKKVSPEELEQVPQEKLPHTHTTHIALMCPTETSRRCRPLRPLSRLPLGLRSPLRKLRSPGASQWPGRPHVHLQVTPRSR